MHKKSFDEIEPIFDEAVKLPKEKQGAYLDKACAGNPGLRAEIASLLAADAESSAFLGGSAMALLTNDADVQSAVAGGSPEQLEKAHASNFHRCHRGHSFDQAIYHRCPTCGVPGLEMEGVRLAQQIHVRGQAHTGQSERIPAVTGWLVCIEGPDCGRDYRLLSGSNSIGRGNHADICIANDSAITEEQHAVLSYDAARNIFWLAPGPGRAVTSLNHTKIAAPTMLRSQDTVRIGRTLLRFIPFCGETFQWK